MGTYQLTPAADADLDEIWVFVAEDAGVSRADTLEQELHEAMQRLGDFPGIGHVRHDLADEVLRFWPVHQFLIVYRAEERPVQIVRVLHSARDVQAILSG